MHIKVPLTLSLLTREKKWKVMREIHMIRRQYIWSVELLNWFWKGIKFRTKYSQKKKNESDKNVSTGPVLWSNIQGDSVARSPKLLSIKNCYWDNDLKIYIHIPGTMQNRTCSQSMLKLVSFHIQAHLNAFLQILEYFSQSVDIDV